MILEQHDLHSAAWIKIKAHVEAELTDTKTRLESDAPKKRTIQLRERIRVFKELLALGEPDPATGADDE